MSVIEKAALGITILFLAVVAVRLFRAPARLLLRLLGNTAMGCGGLWLLHLAGAAAPGLNWFNALVVGVLGLPGLGLLLLTQWVLGT